MQNYELLGTIGQGQYGTAHKARHRGDGQLYCIKRIGLSNKEDQSGALKEVQLLSQLDHPNIIGYKESFLDKDGALCIATTFCEEGDLFTRIRQRQQANQFFNENEVMDMFVQIASALMHIHSKRILHRDLKTQNIFIAKGNIIKLGDFGISKVLEKTDQFATTVTGTPYYMAPEICTNQPYTFKSDIWSLGCVLYELCTLKHAFAADSLLSLVYQIVRGNFPPIPANQFSPGLSNLVNSLLVRDAAQRPSLTQIFQMPYVLQHLQRYNSESKRSLLKHSSTMAKRKAALEASGGATQGAGAGRDTLANVASQDDDTGLTPKQKLQRKRQQEIQRREMELQIANIDLQRERGVAAQRKQANIIGSNALGLPGSSTPSKATGRGGLGGDASDQLVGTSSGSRLSTPPTGSGNAWGSGDTGGFGLEDSMVNMGTVIMGTMPAGAALTAGYGSTLPSAAVRAAAAAATSSGGGAGGGGGGGGGGLAAVRQSQAVSKASAAVASSYQAREDRPVRTSMASRQVPLAAPHGQLPTYRADEDGVMMDTMSGTVAAAAVSASGRSTPQPGLVVAGVRPGSKAGAARPGPRASLTANPPPPPVSLTNGAAKYAAASASSGGGAAGALPAYAAQQRPESPARHPSPSRVSHQQPISPSPIPVKSKFGAAPSSHQPQPRASSEYAIRAEPHHHQPPLTSAAAGRGAPTVADDPDFDLEDDDYDDGGHNDYESDFEDYTPADDEETINQKHKILNQMQDLERTRGKAADWDDAITQVREKVGTTIKNTRSSVLRERCQAALGFHFPEVYAYLKRTRNQEQATDEMQVQKQLQELVGGDRTLLQGCFLVDQLVFQEMMT